MEELSLLQGRYIFGTDIAAYIHARPEYPEQVFATLTARCGLRPGAAVLEIGPGTGLATKRILSMGVSQLCAVEPDENFSDFLAQTYPNSSLALVRSTFEAAELPADSFDVGISATAFHWLEQSAALAKLKRVLKPGGCFAMWWTHFGNPGEQDPFEEATDHLFRPLGPSPAAVQGDIPFALDRERRLADFHEAGFHDPQVHFWHWKCTYETARLVSLYNTFSPIRALSPSAREQILGELTRISDQQFEGRVERPFITAFYSGLRPVR